MSSSALHNVLALSHKQKETLLKLVVLSLSAIVSFTVRLFAVIRFESVIHEFDPYFNYRTTKYLTEEGYYSFHNWFDAFAWYPLGRLMLTSMFIHRFLNLLNVSIDIREVCVFLAPLFSSFTVLITYLLTKEVQSEGAGLIAAALIAIVPGYISRSVAGSYDNEGIAIFCMLLTYYLWVKSVKTGSIFNSVLCALAYFYMVSSWGGYVFLINLIPLHVLALICTGRFSHRVYVAYSTVYTLGTILSMQIPFVGFQPVSTSEHMGAFAVFGFCQIVAFAQWMRSKMAADRFQLVLRSILLVFGGAAFLALILATFLHKIAPWTGRFYSLLDPSYAKNNIPIIASVSEHQPTAWSSFYFDLQFLVFTFPAGLYFCFKKLTDQNIFIILYGLTSIYFAGVMVRLMLVLAPIMCILGGIAVSSTLSSYIANVDLFSGSGGEKPKGKPTAAEVSAEKGGKAGGGGKSGGGGGGGGKSGGGGGGGARHHRGDENYPYKQEIALVVTLAMAICLISFVYHSTWVTSEAYSSPSIVLSARSGDGGRIIFDDFREAYYWLRKNTPEDAKVMSWWDYGYQISAMANRTTIVDNNTWNNTHISRVGQAMASNESHAYEIMHELDVDYVLFLWMVRIGGSTPEGRHIHENDYYTKNGEFRIDKEGSATMLNCLMYKLCYHRFGTVHTEHGRPTGYDRVRHAEIGNKNFDLLHLEEAYTSEHWIVRVFRVLKPSNRR
uniref:Dolichyl-diphosphooligosaccharide--protein glycosyltransferase subunit STT3A n=1 Tax=Globodera rostochiensis TaxID=31243 RepID=A0A914HWW0_GLORO